MLLGPEADPAHAAAEPPMPLETFVGRLERELGIRLFARDQEKLEARLAARR